MRLPISSTSVGMSAGTGIGQSSIYSLFCNMSTLIYKLNPVQGGHYHTKMPDLSVWLPRDSPFPIDALLSGSHGGLVFSRMLAEHFQQSEK